MDRLPADHRSLFAAAVDRLARQRAATVPLLEALSLALGRGLPRVDRTWVSVASALNGGAPVTERDVDYLLVAGAPYVMIDAQYGQSVYRLAHRTFVEHFLARGTHGEPNVPAASAGSGPVDRHGRITRALIATATCALPSPPNPYVVFHLAEHAGAALAW